MQHGKKLLIVLAILFILLLLYVGQRNRFDSTISLTPTASVIAFDLQATQFAQTSQSTIDMRATTSYQQTQTSETQAAMDLLSQRSATAEMLALATVQASPMLAHVEQLYDQGVLKSIRGTYFQLSDFDASWALRDYYDLLLTDYTVSDFVVGSQIEWDSVETNANNWNSGCGFVFRLNARGDHYLVFLGSDGWAYLYLTVDHRLSKLGRGRFSDVGLTSGMATFVLVGQGENFTLFVNDAQIFELEDSSLSTGFLGFAIASGTNQDPGTHCQMKNVELWKLVAP